MSNIVQTNTRYSSEVLKNNIAELKSIYPFLEVFSLGKSVLGDNIPCIQLGNGKKKVFYTASIHANEWITSPLLMKFIENFCTAYVNNSNIFGYSAKNIFDSCTMYIAPMCNPDGVNLVTGSFEPDSTEYNRAKQISTGYPHIPFPSGWKANISRDRS